jgi:hypothetical protein
MYITADNIVYVTAEELMDCGIPERSAYYCAGEYSHLKASYRELIKEKICDGEEPAAWIRYGQMPEQATPPSDEKAPEPQPGTKPTPPRPSPKGRGWGRW